MSMVGSGSPRQVGSSGDGEDWMDKTEKSSTQVPTVSNKDDKVSKFVTISNILDNTEIENKMKGPSVLEEVVHSSSDEEYNDPIGSFKYTISEWFKLGTVVPDEIKSYMFKDLKIKTVNVAIAWAELYEKVNPTQMQGLFMQFKDKLNNKIKDEVITSTKIETYKKETDRERQREGNRRQQTGFGDISPFLPFKGSSNIGTDEPRFSTIRDQTGLSTTGPGIYLSDSFAEAFERVNASTQLNYRPPKFESHDDPQVWLKKYEKASLVNKWGDTQKLKNFTRFVNDEVLQWVIDQFGDYEQLSRMNWDTLKTEFLREYMSRDQRFENRLKLNNLKQESDEPVRKYLQRGLELCEVVEDTMSDVAKIDILVAGIDKNIRRQLLNLSVWPIAGVRDLIAHAVNAERLNNVNHLINTLKLDSNEDSNEERQYQYNKSYGGHTEY